ncbi:thioredoxin domain-containing protein [Chlorobaculum sp. 24CR]|uniref:thioredoxin domain-containing protein n=1 Tax=Chlorobaculum sp. 24CR TaxID=2508878 RepID=UPI00100BFD5D|nr:thioredoxin domain-containing protein [Chlorobaculum sp. 24CR]RXK84883.1 thioredoxin domain-containing protein [Chlorobaculum sp. 24CR]
MEKQPNKLINEKSPYLLQHAWNPVDWHPWGEEAFRKARETGRPIFLSSGYSTCHWCHVMEHESFENPETAALLNRHFVPVKLDREEHPDVDHLYMIFVQATTGRGGWPMSVWMTPDLKPFFGGSYFPDTERWGMPSFRSVLKHLADLWERDRPRLLASAGSIMDQLAGFARPEAAAGEVTDRHASACFASLERGFDAEWGGFGGEPKFPRPAVLSFLFSHAAATGNRHALDMALLTLRKMADGGIHDQLGVSGLGGGGFARYSTDRFWRVPHFEKMLYDNAQLAASYLEAYQASGEELFADTARDIFNYVLCDMTSPEGAFWSAEDADSLDTGGSGKKREGAFYLWTEAEVSALLNADEAALFGAACGIRREGNAPFDPHGEFTGKNIPFRAKSNDELAEAFGIPVETIRQRLDSARKKLFEAREKRPRPGLDDKILTSWNGLMISALAKGSLILGDQKLLEAAERSARFILDTLYDSESGHLLRRYRDGEAAIEGKAADYACLILGLLDLYSASFDADWLRAAIRLAEAQIERFFDEDAGVFYSTAADDQSVPLRMIEDNDNAEPSANSVNALNYLRLAAITGRDELRDIALRTIRHFSRALDANPSALPLLLVARQIATAPPVQIIFAGKRGNPALAKLVATAFRHNRPELTVIHADETGEELLPEAAQIGRTHKGEPAAYLCADGSCQPAISDPESLDAALGSLK